MPCPVPACRKVVHRAAALMILAVSVLVAPACSHTAEKPEAPNIAAEPQTSASPPTLVLNIRDFGAIGDGKTKDTAAIQEAINRCFVLGGGQVAVPAGNYLTGSLALRSNVVLCLKPGATITGSADDSDYPLLQVRWEGKWIQGHAGLIYAIDAHRVGIVGPGKIVGFAPAKRPPNSQIPLRRPVLIEPIDCDDVRLDGFSTSYRGMWSLHPTCCTNVNICNLTIRSTGGNGDGIDVDSCAHVRIDRCDISTGDDCISLKSGRGSEGYLLHRPTEDVRISNCTFADSLFACIGIGSETSGGIRNVDIEHCKVIGAKSFAIYIKSRIGRGASIENITANDLDVGRTQGGLIRVNLLSSGKQDQNPVPGDAGIPAARNFRFTNIRVSDAPMLVDGTKISRLKPLDGFTLSNVSGTCGKGIYLASVRDAELSNIHVSGYAGALVNTYNVTGSGLAGAAALKPPQNASPIPAPAEPYELH